MTEHVNIRCDRCKQMIDGAHDPAGAFTAGFYNVASGGGWAEFARPNEMVVCDACMWSDEKYIKVHGRHKIESQ
jgi:hypothetical protein